MVIQDRHDYLKEGYKQLSNLKFYLKLNKDLTAEFKEKIDKLTRELFDSKQITEKTLLFMLEGGNHTPIFYMLPKIHKDKTCPPEDQ